MGNKILLLDTSDPPDGSLSELLAQCGFVVQIAKDIDSALRLLRNRPPASVVIRVADAAAIDLCRSLRMFSTVPVVVICTRRDEDLVVWCLEAGADSVLIAPLSRRELVARLGTLLGGRNGLPPAEPRSQAYHIGDLVIDPDAHVVTKAGLSPSLTPTEFRLLVALARRAGEVVGHAELLSEVWGTTYRESPENLRLYIRYLRQKLGDDRSQPRLILNHRGVGYRLAAGARATNGKGRAHGHYQSQIRDGHAGARRRVRAGRALAARRG